MAIKNSKVWQWTVKYLPFLGVAYKGIAFAFRWAISNGMVATSIGLGTLGVATGVSSTARLAQVQENQRAFQQQVVAINEAGDDTQADLEELERRIAERISVETKAQADSLRATAELLKGDLRQTALEAADNLDREAERLDGDVEVTNEVLQESVEIINKVIAEVEQASIDADEVISLNVVDLNTARQLEIAAIQAENAVVPPVGSLVWVVDTTLVDLNYYTPCDGATVGSVTLPNVNANGLFIRGGVFTGSIELDTTAVNGLSVGSAGSHSHTISGDGATGITSGSADADIVLNNSDGDQNHGSSTTNFSGNHTHALSGDAETAPTHITATCYVRTQ